MATKSVSRNDIANVELLQFIRRQNIKFSITGTKPLTRMYAFFDGIPVSEHIVPDGGVKGDSLVTDVAGRATGYFDVPDSTFYVGSRIFTLRDVPTSEASTIPGSLVASGSAKFTASGLRQTFQRTQTDTIDVVNVTNVVNEQTDYTYTRDVNSIVVTNRIENTTYDPAPAPIEVTVMVTGEEAHIVGLGDPLAQTFFTYGVTGGCFVTEMDIWFQAKDLNLPCTLEIREVVNGYPGPTKVSKWASVVKLPSTISVSDDSSLATKFQFQRPIYLAENKDYCFVLLANSNEYFVWTSKFGDKSIETGKTIFEQPYIGSMFKSENNITWTAEQTEDIKFVIYKAQFDTNVEAMVTSKVNAPPMKIFGRSLSVINGSPVVTAVFDFQHGHKTGDVVMISGITGAWYRGIPGSTFNSTSGFNITVIDKFSFTFNCGVNATSTGKLISSGIVNIVDVDNTGAGYVNPTIVFSGGGPGATHATATPNVVGGKIVSVTMNSFGTGYTSTPTLSLTDTVGTGAILIPTSEAIFFMNLNRPYQNLMPLFFVDYPPSTGITNTIRTSDENYVVGQHKVYNLNESEPTHEHSVLVAQNVELDSFGNNASTQLITRLRTDNPNVSPMIDLSENPRVLFQNIIINDDSNSASELTPDSGTAYSRYISRIVGLETVSKGCRIFVNAASVKETSFDVFIKTSMANSTSPHDSGNWQLLSCDVDRHQSRTWNEYKDYLFYLDEIAPFDTYSIKIVLYSDVQYVYPKIANYRSVILAT